MQAAITYLISQLQTIPNIENVTQALPFVKDKSALLSEFQSDILGDAKNLQAWEVSNVAGAEAVNDSGNVFEWQDTYAIHGWLKFNDEQATQQMQSWIDTIKVLFKRDKTLGKTVRSRGPLRLVANQPDWFYSTLCHHCEFQVTAISLIPR